jgi:hypothetical protein
MKLIGAAHPQGGAPATRFRAPPRGVSGRALHLPPHLTLHTLDHLAGE